MKIIDTHCHIYPDKIASKAAAATGTFYGLPASHDGSVSALLERAINFQNISVRKNISPKRQAIRANLSVSDLLLLRIQADI